MLSHDVLNQAPPLVDFNPFDAYPALGEALVASLVQFTTGRVSALSA